MDGSANITTLAPIDVSELKIDQGALRDQPSPQLLWVKMSDLVIDRSYQRDISGQSIGTIKRIVEDFDWTKYTPILLAAVDGGKFAVVDGQHRAHAAKLCGIESLPAMVVPMSLAQQAKAFAAVNSDRVKVTRHVIYRAELAAGTKWAVECRDAVEAAGCTLSTSAVSFLRRKPKQIHAVGLVKKMIDAGIGNVLTIGLRAIVNSEQADSLRAYDGNILKHWFLAIESSQAFLKLDLAEAFDTIDIDELIENARLPARENQVTATSIVVPQIVAHLRAMK